MFTKRHYVIHFYEVDNISVGIGGFIYAILSGFGGERIARNRKFYKYGCITIVLWCY